MFVERNVLNLLFAFVFFITSCKNNDSITGKWKIVHFELYSPHDTISLNLSDINSLKKMRDRMPSAWIAPIEDAYIDSLQNCYLELNRDSSFTLTDEGFLLRTEPGIHIGRDVSGTWHLDKGSEVVKLELMPELIKSFKILKQSADTLTIGETTDASTPFTNIVLLKQ